MEIYNPPKSEIRIESQKKKFHFSILLTQLGMSFIVIIGAVVISLYGINGLPIFSYFVMLAVGIFLISGVYNLHKRTIYGYFSALIFLLLLFLRSLLGISNREERASNIVIGDGAFVPINQGELSGAIFYELYAPIFFSVMTGTLIVIFIFFKRIRSEFFTNNA